MPPAVPSPLPSRRRVLRQLLALPVAATGAALAGCRPRDRGGSGGVRELSVWTLDLAPRFSSYMRGVIASWEQRHPGVRVRWTDVPWSSVERKLLASVFARTAPDLVNLNPPFAANLASKGGLLDLRSVLPPGAADGYLPRIWE
ncbi:MAG: extracellular solute-binding protein, partial [Synechococcaceae cyanobacterium]|nr:extracellular solute-binding protein [Synechococcaceae cyanobacterium]